MQHQTLEERSNFLRNKLKNWLFLWVQNEDKKKYTCDYTFKETSNQFEDDVMTKWYKEAKLEEQNRQKSKVWKQQEEVDADEGQRIAFSEKERNRELDVKF